MIRTRLFVFLLLATVAWARPEVNIEVLREGRGPKIKVGQKAQVGYTLTLDSGKLIDQAGARDPFEFEVGSNKVVPGFSQGVEGMREGEMRKIVIPPELAYGKRGTGPIPPDSTLHFQIELYRIEGGEAEHAHEHDAECDDPDHDHQAGETEEHDHDHGLSMEEEHHHGHDHGPAGMSRSEAFRNEEYLNQRHARDLTRPAMYEYLIREFYTKPWRYDDGYLEVGKSTLKVFGFLLLLIGFTWVGVRKGYLSK